MKQVKHMHKTVKQNVVINGVNGTAIKVENNRIRVQFANNGKPFSRWYNMNKITIQTDLHRALYTVWQPVRKMFPYTPPRLTIATGY